MPIVVRRLLEREEELDELIGRYGFWENAKKDSKMNLRSYCARRPNFVIDLGFLFFLSNIKMQVGVVLLMAQGSCPCILRILPCLFHIFISLNFEIWRELPYYDRHFVVVDSHTSWQSYKIT